MQKPKSQIETNKITVENNYKDNNAMENTAGKTSIKSGFLYQLFSDNSPDSNFFISKITFSLNKIMHNN